MDTDAIYSAISSKIVSSKRGDHVEAEFYQDEIKRLLNEADAERQVLLATNEKLVDEVAELKAAYESQFKELHELKAKLTEKASLLRGCYAADHKQKQRIEELTSELERIKALEPVAWRSRVKGVLSWWVELQEPPERPQQETQPLYALGSKTNG